MANRQQARHQVDQTMMDEHNWVNPIDFGLGQSLRLIGIGWDAKITKWKVSASFSLSMADDINFPSLFQMVKQLPAACVYEIFFSRYETIAPRWEFPCRSRCQRPRAAMINSTLPPPSFSFLFLFILSYIQIFHGFIFLFFSKITLSATVSSCWKLASVNDCTRRGWWDLERRGWSGGVPDWLAPLWRHPISMRSGFLGAGRWALGAGVRRQIREFKQDNWRFFSFINMTGRKFPTFFLFGVLLSFWAEETKEASWSIWAC